jgi:hypothetical protein
MALTVEPFPSLDLVTEVFRALASDHDGRGSALDAGVKEAIDPAPRLPAWPAGGNVGEGRLFGVHGVSAVSDVDKSLCMSTVSSSAVFAVRTAAPLSR